MRRFPIINILNALLAVSLPGLVLIVALIAGLLIFGAKQQRRARLQSLSRGLLVSLATVGLLLAAGEAYFRFVHADPAVGLAQANWIHRYWKTNALGFRDREWTSGDLEGRRMVIVLGDSFAAGWGIENPANRFSDVLAGRLGEDYAVINAALPGTTTPRQLEILKSYPLKDPDVVILQYFLNDIEDAAVSIARNWTATVPTPPRLAEESYLANYLYWAIAPRLTLVDAAFGQSYWRWEYSSYDDAQIWNIHRQQIEALIDYVERIQARLIVVVFPNLLDPVTSIAYVDRVAQIFEARGHADILKLYDVAAAWPLGDVVVSARDAHPSDLLHRYIGNTLYEQFFADG